MPYLQVKHADIYFEVVGAGQALLFAHGLGGNHLSWWQQVPHFKDRFTCITFAHRGFYPSRGSADPERNGDDLVELLDHLGIADVVLIAQSMGGWGCVEFAIMHPERVRAIVLADTVGTLRFSEEDGAPSLPSRAPELIKNGIHPACGERMAREQPFLHYLYREIDALSVDLDKGAILETLSRLRRTPPQALSKHDPRLMWIWGMEDVVLLPSLVELARRHFPNARIELIPEAGHSVYFERPGIFNALVDDFLNAND